jgi:hypothetical protein
MVVINNRRISLKSETFGQLGKTTDNGEYYE